MVNKLRGKRNSAVNSKFMIITENEFNEYFVSQAPKLNDPDDYTIINIEPVQPFSVFLGQSNASSVYLQDCTTKLVK